LKKEEKSNDSFEETTLKQISEVTGLTLEEINYVHNNYKYYKGLHGYFKDLKKNNKRIPEDYSELREMMKIDKPEFNTEIQRSMYDYIRKKQNLSQKEIKEEEKRAYLKTIKLCKNTWKF